MSTPADKQSVDHYLALPEVEQYKVDRRSRVWKVRDGEGDSTAEYVVKQYRHPSAKQRATWLVGLHPVQREARAVAKLTQARIPVVPITATGMHKGRGILVTRYAGPSLQVAVQQGMLDDHARRVGVLERVVALTASLVESRWFFRDLQLANMVLGDDNQVMLIDTGSIRRSGSPHHTVRMLGLLARTARMEGVPWPTCLRGLLLAAAAISKGSRDPGAARTLAGLIAEQPDLWPLPEGWVPPRFAGAAGGTGGAKETTDD